jgi:caffeoyl-CoA O-methyltransferase
MFSQIPAIIEDRMDYLRALDKRDRQDSTPRLIRLRQIPPETGRFIALLAASAPQGRYIEIGTSGGYSALWLALACREAGTKMTTFEILEEKIEFASETFRVAGVEDVVELVHGDAREYLETLEDISFCFLDPEKEVYRDCYEMVIPRMVKGGILIADNAISHREVLASFLDRVMKDQRVDALVVPIGSGELLCRKC